VPAGSGSATITACRKLTPSAAFAVANSLGAETSKPPRCCSRSSEEVCAYHHLTTPRLRKSNVKILDRLGESGRV